MKKSLIKSWDEVDKSLLTLTRINSTTIDFTNSMNKEIQGIKVKYGEDIKSNETEEKKILEGLESFFIDHEDDPEVKGKTYEGPYGKCGLRLTPPSIKPIKKMTWKKVLLKVIELGYKTKLLRPLVYDIKDIDRELLASNKVTEDTRKEIGVCIYQEERFWYETK